MCYTVAKEVVSLVIRHEDLIGSFEQKKALVAQFNLMDDTFFSVVMEHNDAAEYLLTQLLGKPVKIIENKTQYSIRNAESHSIVLDALVEDEEHNIYDVEVQVGDRKNHERRIRYYRTAIDWSYLEKGKDYADLPELYMIFISDFDPFDLNRNHYESKEYVRTASYAIMAAHIVCNSTPQSGTTVGCQNCYSIWRTATPITMTSVRCHNR